jgi:hypothetical protein
MPPDPFYVHTDKAIPGKRRNHQVTTIGKAEGKSLAACRYRNGPAISGAQETPLFRTATATTYPGQPLPDQKTTRQETIAAKVGPEPLIVPLLPCGKITRGPLGSRNLPLVKQGPVQGRFLSHCFPPLLVFTLSQIVAGLYPGNHHPGTPAQRRDKSRCPL